MIKFDARLLAATALAQANGAARFYLCGVYFDGACAVATNGIMLTISNDPGSSINGSGIYPVSKKAVAALKSTPSDGHKPFRYTKDRFVNSNVSGGGL